MKLADLYEDIKKDFPIDKTDLLGEQVKTSKLFGKYIELWSNENLALSKMESDRAKIVSKLREFHSGAADAAEYLKRPVKNDIRPKTETGLQKLVDNDEVLISYDESILVQRQKVMVLENCLKEVNARNFAINSAMKFQMFLNGSY